MLKRILLIVSMILLGLIMLPLLEGLGEQTHVSPLAEYYLSKGAGDLNSPNLVTAVVVTYRGLDTLGEVTVLFAAAAGIMLAFKGLKITEDQAEETQGPSELLASGASLLFPILFIFGIYIFTHGHLSPGGGFQGGVVIASAALLLLLSGVVPGLSHLLTSLLEALAGASYVAIGLLGLYLAAGFLDPRFLPRGEWSGIFSAGAIPVIYSLVGIKVGSELSAVLGAMISKGGEK